MKSLIALLVLIVTSFTTASSAQAKPNEAQSKDRIKVQLSFHKGLRPSLEHQNLYIGDTCSLEVRREATTKKTSLNKKFCSSIVDEFGLILAGNLPYPASINDKLSYANIEIHKGTSTFKTVVRLDGFSICDRKMKCRPPQDNLAAKMVRKIQGSMNEI